MDLNDLYQRRGEAMLRATNEADGMLRQAHVARAQAYQERIVRLRELRRDTTKL
jgi:hypothetical protein